MKMFVEKEISGSFTVLYRKGSKGLILVMELHHASKIDRADDIDIVQNERLVVREEPGGLLQAAAGIEQELLARNFDTHAEVIVLFEIGLDHVGEMVHVDDHFGYAEKAQTGECDFE